ncbi:hypothetical protein DFJ63DRAFT_312892 [Scheffersomyces coipomensis]|uniref:uncharacterized protein n=1 Tax=Scheffersomyces coipomensis TaxID=1788519 RepID=UPI00315DE22F
MNQRCFSYDDFFIATFFNNIFPKFPYDSIVGILRLLSIPEIVILQTLINDDYVKGIRIDQITKQRLTVRYRDSKKGMDPCLLRSIFQEKFKIKTLFHTITDLTKFEHINPIPVEFNFQSTKSFPILYLDEFIRNSNSFDIALNFFMLKYSQFKKLENCKKAMCVSIIRISDIVGKGNQSVDLDLSKYSNLKVFECRYCLNFKSLRLDSAFNTLTKLIIPDVCDQDYLSKFINLKYLDINFKEEFVIKKVPRTIVTLCLISYNENSEIIIQSQDDWPKGLESVEFNVFRKAFEGVIIGLPFYLKKLTIMYRDNSEFTVNLPSLPASLIEFDIATLGDYTYMDSTIVSIQGDNLKKLEFFRICLLDDSTKPVYIAPGIEEFKFRSGKCSFDLNDLNFEYAKLSLKKLEICFMEKHVFTQLDFEEFSKLESVILESCIIENLNNLKLPLSLRSLRFRLNHFISVDHSCPLFGDPMKYPNLVSLSFMNCDIDYISTEIQLPKYLQILEVPLSNNKQLFSKILNHECLTYLRIFPLTSLEYFDKFKDFSISNSHNNSKIRRLECILPYPASDTDLTVKVYKSIEKAFGKIIERKWFRSNTFHFVLGST